MVPATFGQRVNASPALQELQRDIERELNFHADATVQFDPLIAITLLSIIVQVIIHCRAKRSDADILATMRELRTVPPRKLLKLRRQLNTLWRERYANEYNRHAPNPLLQVVYELSERISPETADALMTLAQQPPIEE